VPAQTAKTFRVAIVGSETLRGKEIKSVLNIRRFPLFSLEFYDPGVDQEFSKLTQFREEPKVVHHLEPRSLAGLDLVFLAADVRTDTVYGELAGQMDYRAIDLSEAFNTRREVPVVVAGVNDAPVRSEKPRLIANPNPVTIILSHLFQAVQPVRSRFSDIAGFVQHDLEHVAHVLFIVDDEHAVTGHGLYPSPLWVFLL